MQRNQTSNHHSSCFCNYMIGKELSTTNDYFCVRDGRPPVFTWILVFILLYRVENIAFSSGNCRLLSSLQFFFFLFPVFIWHLFLLDMWLLVHRPATPTDFIRIYWFFNLKLGELQIFFSWMPMGLPCDVLNHIDFFLRILIFLVIYTDFVAGLGAALSL